MRKIGKIAMLMTALLFGFTTLSGAGQTASRLDGTWEFAPANEEQDEILKDISFSEIVFDTTQNTLTCDSGYVSETGTTRVQSVVEITAEGDDTFAIAQAGVAEELIVEILDDQTIQVSGSESGEGDSAAIYVKVD